MENNFPSNLQFCFFKFCKNCDCCEPMIKHWRIPGQFELTCEHANACSRLAVRENYTEYSRSQKSSKGEKEDE